MTWCARADAARALEAMNTQAFRQGRDALVSVLVFLLAGAALAEGTYLQFLQALANAESSNQPGIVNEYGYVGLFQMGELALQDAGYYRGDGTRDTNDWTGGWTGRDGINSLADFQASPQAQVNAVTRYHQVIENYISANGLRKYIGTTINGVVLTESGLVAGAHLVGMGNLGAWLRSGGRVVPMDGNKVPVTSYASRFAGYGVSASPPAYWGPGGSTTPVTTPITPAPAAGSTPWLRSPGAGASAYADPASAFLAATGSNMAEVRVLWGSALAMLLFCWVAWSTHGSYQSWMRRQIGSAWTLQRDAVGMGVLLLIVIWLVT